jgi:hypothetical protein
MRTLLAILVLAAALTSCGSHDQASPAAPSSAPCTAAGGGRCAGDAAWKGPIRLSSDGQRLYGEVPCGGILTAVESAGRVTIRLDLRAVRPGGLTCALADVGVTLPDPLGSRSVVDAVSGRTIRVVGR